MNNIVDELRKVLPPVFAGASIDALTGDTFKWRTIQNQRSRKEIPGVCFAYNGHRVLVIRDPFLDFMADSMSSTRPAIAAPGGNKSKPVAPEMDAPADSSANESDWQGEDWEAEQQEELEVIAPRQMMVGDICTSAAMEFQNDNKPTTPSEIEQIRSHPGNRKFKFDPPALCIGDVLDGERTGDMIILEKVVGGSSIDGWMRPRSMRVLITLDCGKQVEAHVVTEGKYAHLFCWSRIGEPMKIVGRFKKAIVNDKPACRLIQIERADFVGGVS